MLLHEMHGFRKPYIIAITFKGLRFSVFEIGVIKIIVTPIIGGMPDSATTMHEHFIKSPVLWAKGVAVSQMPFSKNTGSVTRFLKHCRKHDLVFVYQLPSIDGMPYTHLVVVFSGHQHGPGR